MAKHCLLCEQPIDAATHAGIVEAMDERIFKHLVDFTRRRARFAGRPIKPPVDGERATLSLMVTPTIKERLDHAAQRNGRTRSQEAEQRIEWSFDRVDLVPEVLRVAYGEDVAAVLAILGLVMSARGRQPETFPVALKEAFSVLGALTTATEQDPDGMQRLLRLGNVEKLLDSPEGEPVRKLLERRQQKRGELAKVGPRSGGRTWTLKSDRPVTTKHYSRDEKSDDKPFHGSRVEISADGKRVTKYARKTRRSVA